MNILLVDDEPVALTSLARLLKRRGYRKVKICPEGREAINLISKNDFDIVLLDLLMPEVDGLQVLEAAKPHAPGTEFIMLTAVDDVATAVKALRLGAYDYLIKPMEIERLIISLERAYERRGLRAGMNAGGRPLDKQEAIPAAFAAITTQSSRMRELIAYAEVMARSGNPVLITGESGTGKELIARAVRQAGPNPNGPFVAANVASIPESLFESTFFGHIKGAFTGAAQDFPGLFAQANGGTLFLDEIGELPLHLQAKFLRVLEEKSMTRLGDPREIPVDARIISATNKDLDLACQEGSFRLDLLYRIKAIHIRLPPLRERTEDIPLLAAFFLERANQRHHKKLEGFSPEAMLMLGRMPYPGNIRELSQIVENAVLMATGPVITPNDLGEHMDNSLSLVRTLCTLQENSNHQLVYVLTHTGGDRKKAAAILGITIRQVQRKIAELKKHHRWHALLHDI